MKQNRSHWLWITGLLVGAGLAGWLLKRDQEKPGTEPPARALFHKRIFAGPNDLREQLDYLLNHPTQVKAAFRSSRVDDRFKERIMLVVTGVNGCRYCSYGHARAALQAGLREGEIAGLLAGDLDQTDPAQAVALAFAIHHADTAGNPEPGMINKLEATYGEDVANDILITIRMITLGNLAGNTFDALLSRFKGAPAGDSCLRDELATLGLMLTGLIPFSVALGIRMARAGEPRPSKSNVVILQE